MEVRRFTHLFGILRGNAPRGEDAITALIYGHNVTGALEIFSIKGIEVDFQNSGKMMSLLATRPPPFPTGGPIRGVSNDRFASNSRSGFSIPAIGKLNFCISSIFSKKAPRVLTWRSPRSVGTQLG